MTSYTPITMKDRPSLKPIPFDRVNIKSGRWEDCLCLCAEESAVHLQPCKKVLVATTPELSSIAYRRKGIVKRSNSGHIEIFQVLRRIIDNETYTHSVYEDTDRTVAVKVRSRTNISPNVHNEMSAMQLVATRSHDSFIRSTEVLDDGRHIFVVMERWQNLCLYDLIPSRGISLVTVC
jgi:hypothetical protein